MMRTMFLHSCRPALPLLLLLLPFAGVVRAQDDPPPASLEDRLAEAQRELLSVETGDGAPIERLRATMKVRRLETEVQTVVDERHAADRTGTNAKERQRNERLRQRLVLLRERFEGPSESVRSPDLLITNLESVRVNRTVLRESLVPQLVEELDRLVVLRAAVQDRMADLIAPLSGESELHRELIGPVAPDRRGMAERVWLSEKQAYETVLQAHQDVLNTAVAALLELSGIYDEREKILEEFQSFLTAQMLWVRTDEALGLGTLTGLWNEFSRVGAELVSDDTTTKVSRAFGEERAAFVLLSVLITILIAGAIIMGVRFRASPAGAAAHRGTVAAVVIRLLLAVCFAAGPVIPLFVAGLMVPLLELPRVLTEPARTLLLGISITAFFHRLLWDITREDGVLLRMNAPESVVGQLRKATRFATLGAFLLVVPYVVLRDAPVVPALEHLPRIFYTAMLIWYSLVLLSLLRREAPLVAEVTGRRGFWYRLWSIVGPLLTLWLIAVVALDALGFRFGAQLLAASSVKTFLAALVLAGVYNFVSSVLTEATRSVRLRHRAELGTLQAREMAATVERQVGRLVGIGALVVAVLLLARFWEFGTGIRDFFDAIRLTEIGEAEWLTMWDILTAIFWIIGGHFVAWNLGGLLEVALFGRVSGLDLGTRFVITSVTRYTLIFVAYAAAILSLKLSFESLGWALAAVSLGVGFGMQEIVSNFVSGLILLLERPVRVGDIVSVGTTTGTVERIDIRATQLLNFDRQVIIIPNRKFISEEVTNWTHNDLVIRSKIEVGVAYGTDIDRARKVVLEVIAENRTAMKDPAPRVLFLEFGESSLLLRIFVFSEIEPRLDMVNDLHIALQKRFAEEGIEIAFPQRDMHVRTVPPNWPERRRRADEEEEELPGKPPPKGTF